MPLGAYDLVEQVQLVSVITHCPDDVAMAAVGGEKYVKIWNSIDNETLQCFCPIGIDGCRTDGQAGRADYCQGPVLMIQDGP